MIPDSKVYITSFTRRTDNISEQASYYCQPSVQNILRENSLFDALSDNYSRTRYYNTFISFKTDDGYSVSDLGPISFKYPESNEVLSDVFQVSKFSKESSGFLSPGLISFSKNVVIFEMPPTHKLVSHIPYDRESITTQIAQESTVDSYIPVPWQVYIAIFNNDFRLVNTYMYYSRNSIIDSGIKENLYSPALPNFYSNGMLCRPFYASSDDVNKYSQDISGVVAAAYDSVWNSGWNADLVDTILDTSFTAIQNVSSSPSKHALSWFNSNDKADKYKLYLNTLSHISYGARTKAWSLYVRSIAHLTIDEVINTTFSPPACNKLWDHDFEMIRETLAEQFWADNDPEECNEEDLDSYISDNFVNPRSVNKSFEQVLSDVLYRSSQADLYALSNNIQLSNTHAIATSIRNASFV